MMEYAAYGMHVILRRIKIRTIKFLFNLYSKYTG